MYLGLDKPTLQLLLNSEIELLTFNKKTNMEKRTSGTTISYQQGA